VCDLRGNASFGLLRDSCHLAQIGDDHQQVLTDAPIALQAREAGIQINIAGGNTAKRQIQSRNATGSHQSLAVEQAAKDFEEAISCTQIDAGRLSVRASQCGLQPLAKWDFLANREAPSAQGTLRVASKRSAAGKINIDGTKVPSFSVMYFASPDLFFLPAPGHHWDHHFTAIDECTSCFVFKM
jgi:hypothetical protein